jgi:hypothetical protein
MLEQLRNHSLVLLHNRSLELVLHMELELVLHMVQELHMELVLHMEQELRNRSLVLVRSSSSCSSACSSSRVVCGRGEASVGKQVLARSMLVLVLRSILVLAHNTHPSYRTIQPKRSRTR